MAGLKDGSVFNVNLGTNLGFNHADNCACSISLVCMSVVNPRVYNGSSLGSKNFTKNGCMVVSCEGLVTALEVVSLCWTASMWGKTMRPSLVLRVNSRLPSGTRQRLPPLPMQLVGWPWALILSNILTNRRWLNLS